MNTEATTYYTSPIGVLRIAGSERGITSVTFVDSIEHTDIPTALAECTEQFDDYFASRRRVFSFVMDLQGSAFQKRVWEALTAIPFGHTTSYGALSAALGDTKAVRAVGLANGRNPIAIAIPCHRVIGADGSLTGYAGGLHRKQWLLEFEGALAQNALFSPY